MTSTMMFSGSRPEGRLYDLCGQFFFRLATVELFSLYYSVYDKERQVLWGVRKIFAQCQQVSSRERCRGGIYYASQQTNKKVKERLAGVIKTGPTRAFRFMQKT